MTKNVTIACILGVLLAPAMVQAHHDGDIVDDYAERLSCGAPLIRLAIGLGSGTLGECNSLDYQNQAFGSAVNCENSQCQMTALQVEQQANAVPTSPVPLPPEEIESFGPLFFTDLNYIALEGYYASESTYCVRMEIRDANDPPPVCAPADALSGVLIDTGRIEILPFEKGGSTQNVTQGEFGTLPGHDGRVVRIELAIHANFVADRLYQGPDIGEADAWFPVNPQSTAEVEWFRENPDETSLEIAWSAYGLDGEHLHSGSRSIPYLGQVIAAGAR